MVLPMQALWKLIKASPPLIEDFISLNEQIQANGFDLTLRDIASLTSPGRLSAGNKRTLSKANSLAFGADDWVRLAQGTYLVTYNEIVNLPKDIMAIGRPRSSLLRCGVSIGTAVWDAGYSGRSQSLLVIHNPAGFMVQKNARILQLVFLRLETATRKTYHGRFQRENVGDEAT